MCYLRRVYTSIVLLHCPHCQVIAISRICGVAIKLMILVLMTLESPSIGEYWNISGVLVLPKNVIFVFFRTCWWHPEANNTGTPKWFSIDQYLCTLIFLFFYKTYLPDSFAFLFKLCFAYTSIQLCQWFLPL